VYESVRPLLSNAVCQSRPPFGIASNIRGFLFSHLSTYSPASATAAAPYTSVLRARHGPTFWRRAATRNEIKRRRRGRRRRRRRVRPSNTLTARKSIARPSSSSSSSAAAKNVVETAAAIPLGARAARQTMNGDRSLAEGSGPGPSVPSGQ